LSQHALFAFSDAVPCWGVDGVVGVAVCAQEITVRAIIRANIFDFINSPSDMNWFAGPKPGPESADTSSANAIQWQTAEKLRYAGPYFVQRVVEGSKLQTPVQRNHDRERPSQAMYPMSALPQVV
jgi:hypothetical protein